MLQLILQGRPIDLYPDTKINMVYENPLFLQDRIPINHSLTFNLPPTPRNTRLFGDPHRLLSPNRFVDYPGLDILFGPVVLASGILSVSKYDGAISVFFKSTAIPQAITNPLSDQDLAEYDLGEFSFDPDFDDPDNYGYQYEQLYDQAAHGIGLFVAGPIRIDGRDWPVVEGDTYPYTHNGIFATSVMYASFYNCFSSSFRINENFAPIPLQDSHAWCYPSPFVHYLVDQVFQGQLLANPFTEGELAKLIAPGYYSPGFDPGRPYVNYQELNVRRNIPEGTAYIDLSLFSSNMPSDEFIKNLLKMFCATLFVTEGRFYIALNRDVFNNTDFTDWSGHRVGRMSISTRRAMSYIYGYQDYGEGQARPGITTRAVDGLVEYVLPGSNESLEVGVSTENKSFTVKKRPKEEETDPDYYSYEPANHGYFSEPDHLPSDESFEMMTSLSPLPMTLDDYWRTSGDFDDGGSATLHRKWFVPLLTDDQLTLPTSVHIMIFQGFQDSPSDPAHSYPLIASSNFDLYGYKIGELNLAWEDYASFIEPPFLSQEVSGLRSTFHQEFQDWVQADKKRIEAYFQLSPSELKGLDFSRKILVDGLLCYSEKIEVSIGMFTIDPARASLIEV